MQETWIQSLGWEDPLEKGKATHSSILAWRIPWTIQSMGFPHSSVGKESSCSAGDAGLIPGSGRVPGGGHGNPLQYSCLENPKDRGAWQATFHGVSRIGYDLMTEQQQRINTILAASRDASHIP